MPIEIIQSDVQYAAKGKLMDLALEIAQTRNLNKVRSQIRQGAWIFLQLQALDYDDYLSRQTRDVITRCLLETADITDLPAAPVLGSTEPPNISIGGSTTIINNYYEAGTAFSNSDADVGTETVVSFASTVSSGAVFHYTVRNSTNQRSGIILASWNGSNVVYTEESTEDIGSTSDLTLAVDYDSGNIRLRATAASNNWEVFGTYYLIDG